MNNLKQIGLAFHNYHCANNAFPRAAITDKRGKPLLSWRVAILPYIGQQALYNKFNLDEPWDSPHNRELLKEMPSTYVCPSRSNAEPFITTYQVFSGKSAMFENGQDIRLSERHRRHVQHDPGRRGQRGGSLDEARRLDVRRRGGTFAPWPSVSPSGRISTPSSPMAPSASSSSRSTRPCSEP